MREKLEVEEAPEMPERIKLPPASRAGRPTPAASQRSAGSLQARAALASPAAIFGSHSRRGARRREKGLDRPAPGSEQGAGNARVRHGSSPWAEGPRGMLQLAWRFLMFQKDSALAPWYRARTADARRAMLEKRALFADIIDGVPTSELKRLDLDSLLRAAAPRYNT